MTIIVGLGPADLAVGGVAVALAQLVAPSDPAAREAIAGRSLLALRAAMARPLERRRLIMTARLAEIQALLLALRTYRSANIAGDDENSLDLDWLQAAERSLEAMIQGDIFLATNPTGMIASWLDLGDGKDDGDAPELSLAAGRWRAEQVALCDLELAIAPHPIPRALRHHLVCPECAPETGWFANFALFLGWQLHKKPHLLQTMLGVDLERPDKDMMVRLAAAFERARQLASGLEQRLTGPSTALSQSRRRWSCGALLEGSDEDRAIRAIAIAFDAPAPALAKIFARLHHSQMPPARMWRAGRQHAAILAGIHARWRRPDWRTLAPAHNALCAGHLEEATRWSHENIAETAGGLSELGDLEYLCGRYLEASDLYGRALEATAIDDIGARMSLQLRFADVLTFQRLTTTDGEARTIAGETAKAVYRNAVEADIRTARLRAACNWAELRVSPASTKRVPSRAAAVGVLNKELTAAGADHVSAERVEAEALRIELIAELAAFDGEGRPNHYKAAEKAARALAALDLSPLPAWVRELANAAIARGLIRPLGSNPSEVLLQRGQQALETAVSGTLAQMDPRLAGLLDWRLAESHMQLAKGKSAKPRNETGVLWLVRTLQNASLAANERVAILQSLRHVLVNMADGPAEEWRLCQALAAATRAVDTCPEDKPTWDLGNALLQRALIWARLRSRGKDLDDLASAVADADAAAEVFAQTRHVRYVFSSLRAKANALLDAGRDDRNADLVGQAEAVFDRIIADHKSLKVNHRELCQTYMSRGDAADLRGVLLVEPASREAGREAARSAYRQALRLAAKHNLPTKGKCEVALKKLQAA